MYAYVGNAPPKVNPSIFRPDFEGALETLGVVALEGQHGRTSRDSLAIVG